MPISLFANWKMNLSLSESVEFAKTHAEPLGHLLSENQQVSLTVCPSDVALYPLNALFKGTPIALGGQNCSRNLRGSFTGDASAQSLHQAGCSYCIVGHSERRKYHGETDEDVLAKVVHLVSFDIAPIICIGETKEEYNNGKTLSVLEQQLYDIFNAFITTIRVPDYLEIVIAYEPVWAIGTKKIPSEKHLEVVLSMLRHKLQSTSQSIRWKLLYGGSVDGSTIGDLRFNEIDGYLIGGASTKFDELKHIVRALTPTTVT